MKKHQVFARLAILGGMLIILCACLSACSPSSAADNKISFTIPIKAGLFSQTATLRVTLLNAAQIKILHETAACTVSQDAGTKTETIHCPDGITYQKVNPEEFTFPIRQSGSSVKVTSATVRLHEQYQITIGGLSADECNSTSTSFTGMAESVEITLNGLSWATTEMACLKYITESQAIRIAVQWASSDHPFRFQGSTIPVTVAQVKLMVLAEALSFQWFPNCSLMNPDPSRYTVDMKVWAVLMDGRWPSGAPPMPTPYPTFWPSTQLVIILDAATGDVINVAVNSIQPTITPDTQ